LIGQQNAGSCNASWYFRQQPHAPTGIGPDVDKLSTIANGEKYIVIAATAAPSISPAARAASRSSRL